MEMGSSSSRYHYNLWSVSPGLERGQGHNQGLGQGQGQGQALQQGLLRSFDAHHHCRLAIVSRKIKRG